MGSWEHGNERSYSVKSVDFWTDKRLLVSQWGLCCVELDVTVGPNETGLAALVLSSGDHWGRGGRRDRK